MKKGASNGWSGCGWGPGWGDFWTNLRLAVLIKVYLMVTKTELLISSSLSSETLTLGCLSGSSKKLQFFTRNVKGPGKDGLYVSISSDPTDHFIVLMMIKATRLRVVSYHRIGHRPFLIRGLAWN